MLWLTGGALAVALAMIVGLVVLIIVKGGATFWPAPLMHLRTVGGDVYLGEVTDVDRYRPGPQVFEALPPAAAERARQAVELAGGMATRRLLRTENYELTGSHFHWVDDFALTDVAWPEWALTIERLEGGRFYGMPVAMVVDGRRTATEPAAVWDEFEQHHGSARDRLEARRELETEAIGEINAALEEARLELRSIELDEGKSSPEYARQLKEYAAVQERAHEETMAVQREIRALNEENQKYQLVLQTADGQQATLALDGIVRAVPANQLSWSGRLGVYLSRWWEFLSEEPREANSEGGVFPAIFGTVVMTLLMSIAVVPFGVLAALYLREYAKKGFIVSAVRVAINNLAGVPSIVFGVFGLGFFCYFVGGFIDQSLYPERLPNPTFGKGALVWASFTLALMTLPVVIVATEEALAAVPNSMREGSYACGASKWQTIWRIVLPRAMPGIMTGMILAMARGAGEVAPLMLVGAVKLAPELPFDWLPPFGTNRSFMHLGFHIFDLGFQSQNSDAARPMVFTTTLLLILIIATLNVAAVWLRGRLRRRFVTAQF